MATLENKTKLAAINRDNHENDSRNNQAGNTNSPRIQEDYFTQVSKEIEGRVTEKLSEEFNRTETRLITPYHGPIVETSRILNRENQGKNEYRSQNNPHP